MFQKLCSHNQRYSEYFFHNHILSKIYKINSYSEYRYNRVCTHIRVLSVHLHTIWPKDEDYEQLQKSPQSWPHGANPKTAAQLDSIDRLATLMKSSMLELKPFSLRVDKLPEGGKVANTTALQKAHG